MELIAIPLTLLAIIGALFLLAKAQKEALHDVFKYASYLVLTLSVFTLSLVLIKTFDHKKKEKRVMKMMKSERGGHEDMMLFHQKMGASGHCPKMEEGACCGKEMGDNAKCEKKIIVKDSIIKKE